MITHSASLYLAAILIWGSTWYVIKFQLGIVAAEVSLVYRFGLAALILLSFCLLTVFGFALVLLVNCIVLSENKKPALLAV